MLLITDTVHPDEPCYGLAEGPLLLNMPDGSTQWRWVQEVTVIRNDKKHQWRRDLGSTKLFKQAVPLFMPSFGENSVAQLQEFALKNRHDNYWYKRSQEMKAESTLMKDAADQNDEIELARKNISVLGPHLKKQRNDYAPGVNARKLKERREEKTGKKVFHGN